MTAPEHRNILGQGWKASIRLNLQHWAVKDRYGYLVHPSIGVSSSTEPYRIADFGASTARWAIELGIELNASGIKNQVDGFDVSTEQFPHPAWVPDNVKLHKQDVLGPFPEEYRARYDVVQIRAFASIATERIVHQLLDSVTWLLKPNGYLQWVDMDPYKSRIVTAKPGTKHPEADKLLGFLRSPPGAETVFSFLPHIDSLCAKRDLATTVKEDLPLRDIDRPLWNQNLAMAHEEFLLRGKLTRDEVNVCLERLIAEFKSGVAFHAETFIVVAQKGWVR